MRCAALTNQTVPVLPYQWSFFHNSLDGRYGDGLVPLNATEQAWAFNLPYSAGASGLVMWDCPQSFNKRVNQTRELIETEVGPLALSIVQRSAACAKQFCSGHGACTPLNHSLNHSLNCLVISSLIDSHSIQDTCSSEQVDACRCPKIKARRVAIATMDGAGLRARRRAFKLHSC